VLFFGGQQAEVAVGMQANCAVGKDGAAHQVHVAAGSDGDASPADFTRVDQFVHRAAHDLGDALAAIPLALDVVKALVGAVGGDVVRNVDVAAAQHRDVAVRAFDAGAKGDQPAVLGQAGRRQQGDVVSGTQAGTHQGLAAGLDGPVAVDAAALGQVFARLKCHVAGLHSNATGRIHQSAVQHQVFARLQHHVTARLKLGSGVAQPFMLHAVGDAAAGSVLHPKQQVRARPKCQVGTSGKGAGARVHEGARADAQIAQRLQVGVPQQKPFAAGQDDVAAPVSRLAAPERRLCLEEQEFVGLKATKVGVQRPSRAYDRAAIARQQGARHRHHAVRRVNRETTAPGFDLARNADTGSVFVGDQEDAAGVHAGGCTYVDHVRWRRADPRLRCHRQSFVIDPAGAGPGVDRAVALLQRHGRLDVDLACQEREAAQPGGLQTCAPHGKRAAIDRQRPQRRPVEKRSAHRQRGAVYVDKAAAVAADAKRVGQYKLRAGTQDFEPPAKLRGYAAVDFGQDEPGLGCGVTCKEQVRPQRASQHAGGLPRTGVVQHDAVRTNVDPPEQVVRHARAVSWRYVDHGYAVRCRIDQRPTL